MNIENKLYQILESTQCNPNMAIRTVNEILALFPHEELKLLKLDFLVLSGDYKELLEEIKDLKMRLEDISLCAGGEDI